MKKVIIALAALTITVASYGQGLVQFNNRIPPDLIAKVTLPDGTTGVSEGFTAQLLGGPAGGTLSPLTPTTTFRTGAGIGFVNPVEVAVPGVAAGAQATFVLRAFNGATYESSSMFGESGPVTVTLGGVPPGGGPPAPPAALTGLQGFAVVPEPTTLALGALGAALVFLRRRK